MPTATENHSDSLDDQETKLRHDTSHSVLYLAPVNVLSAVVVFVVHLISVETLLSIALSVGLTVWVYTVTDENTSYDGSTMSWVLLSFAVVTPISGAISMAFARREVALTHISQLRATLTALYAAHAAWDWSFRDDGTTGRQRSFTDWQKHADAVLVQILGLARDLGRWLSLPNATRARHRVTSFGKKEAQETNVVAGRIYDSMVVRMGRLTDFCETLKQQGLPPNEATRIRQWERMIHQNIEQVRVIKLYRTPQALRSFGRLFTMALPPFYAPYYAMLAHDLNSLGMAVAFAVLTVVALTALFETIAQMEDPFVSSCVLDGVQVTRDLVTDLEDRLMALRKHHFPSAGPLDVPFVEPARKLERINSQIRLFNE